VYLEVVEFQREVNDLGKLTEQRLLRLKMLARSHVIGTQYAQHIRNCRLCQSDNTTKLSYCWETAYQQHITLNFLQLDNIKCTV